uniref:Major facilitator superfamily (MFS) profile domain-containing protein n=2 Tax=Heliothis virescens TaxID=7102 RepID=A0A2A4JQ44_HELVI
MTTKSDNNDETPITFEEALEKTGNGVYNILLVMTCSLILLAIGIDLFGFSLVVAAACDLELTVSEKGILTSLPFVGILLVSYFWGYVSDTRGRRFTLVIPLLLSFILSCISSLSPHWLFLGLFKFLCVCFACAANSATYTLVGESCIQRVRNRYMLMMTCLILLSPAVAGVLTYPTLKLKFAVAMPWLNIIFKPWRLLIIVLALPSGLGAACMYFFSESPKFLFNSGRSDEALAVLRRIHAANHRGSKEEYPENTCIGTVEESVIFTLIASQSIFAFFNFLISYLQNRRRVVLISILCLSAVSGTCLNLVPEPISSVFFFMVFTCTCLGMGILASYFVDIYPTSYRGMAACLSIMVGRSSTFIGINAVGNLIFNQCQITFYMWSLLVLSSAIAAWFLPPDKPAETKQNAV